MEENRRKKSEGEQIEGRNAVLEALKSGRTVERIYLQERLDGGALSSIASEAAKKSVQLRRVSRERLEQMSVTGSCQGVIAEVCAYAYSTVEEILSRAREKGEAPFLLLLDEIEDPHNLGAVIRTANLCGAHGVIIPKNRSASLTAAVARTSAGAINYTPVARVVNLARTIKELKKEGIWFVCADMDGQSLYETDLTGGLGIVIGNEGHGVSRLVRESCDIVASLPVRGEIDSLNASVAAGVFAYEALRQRSL